MLSRLPSKLFPSIMAPSLCQALTALLTVQTVLGNPVASPQYATPPVLKPGQRGAVASESDVCSRIGTELLEQGGNAAGAMVGTVACVGVIGMYHSGTFTRQLQYNCNNMALTIAQASAVVAS